MSSHCIGLMGRVFGHKYIKHAFWGLETYTSNYCLRCGDLMGGTGSEDVGRGREPGSS